MKFIRENFKKMSLIVALIICSIVLLPSVKADESCKEYTNYYFYLYIGEQEEYSDILENTNNSDNVFNKTHHTYFASLVDTSKINESKSGLICIKKDGNDTTTCPSSNVENWTVEKYYQYFKSTMASTEKEEVKVGNDTYRSHILTEGNIKYISHGNFYTADNTNPRFATDDAFSSGNDFVEKATNATILPLPTDTNTVKMTLESDRYKGEVTRVIKLPARNLSENSLPEFVWISGQTAKKSFLIPAVYKVTYTNCPYKATINYYYEGTKTPVKFSDNNNPWTKKDLDDGYTTTVESPKLKGCTPDLSKVDVKIEGKDFVKDVYYKCPVEEDNPKTGNVLIYLAWLVGFGALGYSLYYLFKPKKAEEE